jgi:hypothetical protein
VTFVDLEKLAPEDLIVQYVVECRGSGHFLPYVDYQVIEEWLGASPCADDLLLVLADVLPDFFSQQGDRAKPRSLTGARKLVLRRLKDKAMRMPAR